MNANACTCMTCVTRRARDEYYILSREETDAMKLHQDWCRSHFPCHAIDRQPVAAKPWPTLEQRARRQALERARDAAHGSTTLAQFQAWIAVELKRIP